MLNKNENKKKHKIRNIFCLHFFEMIARLNFKWNEIKGR